MKFVYDKENLSCLKFRKCHLNPTNLSKNLRWCSNLIWKTLRLLHLELPVQKGLMQKLNILCTENEHLHAFYAPTKNRTNWLRASRYFLCLKKIGHYFFEGCIDECVKFSIHADHTNSGWKVHSTLITIRFCGITGYEVLRRGQMILILLTMLVLNSVLNDDVIMMSYVWLRRRFDTMLAVML